MIKKKPHKRSATCKKAGDDQTKYFVISVPVSVATRTTTADDEDAYNQLRNWMNLMDFETI